MKVENVRNFQIVRCHRLGRYNPKSPRPCPIIFKLQWFGNGEAIWAKHRELKDHPYWIQKDFPSVIVERLCALAPIVKAAREQGKKAFLSVDRIVIDDQRFFVTKKWSNKIFSLSLSLSLSPLILLTPFISMAHTYPWSYSSPYLYLFHWHHFFSLAQFLSLL